MPHLNRDFKKCIAPSSKFVLVFSLLKSTGDWLRGRAYPSHGWGHEFESCIAHHHTLKAPGNWSLFAIETQRPCEGDMILLVDKIEKSFGARTLFTGATLQVNSGERYALVGPDVPARRRFSRSSWVSTAPMPGPLRLLRMPMLGYLEQETKLAGDTSIIQEVMDAAIEIKTMGERAAGASSSRSLRLESPARFPRPCLTSMVMCRTALERLGGYELESNARQITRGPGLQAPRISTSRARSSPVAGRCVSRWLSCSSATRISCCLTSPPTTSILKVSSGCAGSSPPTTAPC